MLFDLIIDIIVNKNSLANNLQLMLLICYKSIVKLDLFHNKKWRGWLK